MEIFIKELSSISAGRVLDVGTGKGEFVKLLSTYLKGYTEIIGIDSNPRAVESASKAFDGNNIKILKMDAARMDFEDESFDTVCISNSLHHLPDPLNILSEMKRVLKTGGRFIICEMFCDSQNERQMNHVISHHWAAEIGRIMGVYHNNTYKKAEILKIASSIGLSNLKSFEFIFPDEEEPTEEELKEFFSCFDGLLEKIKDHADYKRLSIEKESFQRSITRIGMSSATELFIEGIK